MAYLVENGLTPQVLMQHDMGPILFKEECVFKKEIRFGDKVEIDVVALECKEDYSRWRMRHQIFVNDQLSAIIQVAGAWMSISKRKLATPPSLITHVFEQMPRAEEFRFYTDEKS